MVVQAVVHEIQLKEVVNALVGGQPEIPFAVDAYLTDKVNAVHDVPDAAVLRESVQIVRIVYDDVSFGVGASAHTVVGRQKMAGGHEVRTVVFYLIDAVGRKEVESLSVSQKRVGFGHSDGL